MQDKKQQTKHLTEHHEQLVVIKTIAKFKGNMVDNLECYKTRLLLKRDQIKNTVGMVYVKYNVPKAIRGLGMDGRAKSFTAPARLSKISQVSKTIRTTYERKRKLQYYYPVRYGDSRNKLHLKIWIFQDAAGSHDDESRCVCTDTAENGSIHGSVRRPYI